MNYLYILLIILFIIMAMYLYSKFRYVLNNDTIIGDNNNNNNNNNHNYSNNNDNHNNNHGQLKEEYYFEKEYKNWAWGYQHTGTLILSNGDIHKYDISKLDDPESNKETKLQHSEIVGHVPSEIMADLYRLLKQVKNIPLEGTGEIAYDAGITSIAGYINNEDGSGWKVIQLHKSGDIGGSHPSNIANELVNKLSEYLK